MLKRAGEMVRTLVAVGAGRSRPAAERRARGLTVAAIAALLESRAALLALRRTLPKSGPGVVACRTPAALRPAARAPAGRRHRALPRARRSCPTSPSSGASCPASRSWPTRPFRPDDGELLLACRRHAVASVAVEGVDDPIVGDMVMRSSITAERRRALADAPRMLRLTEPLQQAAWDRAGGRGRAADPHHDARQALQVSREHLSRQFGAGGAPNLKRVIDLTRVACAAQLLANPGYTIPTVVRVLHFASSSHLSSTARRIANVSTRGLGDLGPEGCCRRSRRGTRGAGWRVRWEGGKAERRKEGGSEGAEDRSPEGWIGRARASPIRAK